MTKSYMCVVLVYFLT